MGKLQAIDPSLYAAIKSKSNPYSDLIHSNIKIKIKNQQNCSFSGSDQILNYMDQKFTQLNQLCTHNLNINTSALLLVTQ